MFIARIKNEKGKTIQIEENVIMELWSRLVEQKYWEQPKNSMYDMANEKEWIQHIDEGLDPDKVYSFTLYKQEEGCVKFKILHVNEEEMDERRERKAEEKKKEEEEKKKHEAEQNLPLQQS